MTAAYRERVETHRAACTLCARSTSRRRGLCWGCYRKLRECEIPMRDRAQPGPRVLDGLREWVRSLSAEQRTLLMLELRNA